MVESSKQGGRFVQRYRATLQAISTRTGTALPSLITSFAILHEVTAIAPLFIFFYAAKTLNVGEQAVGLIRAPEKTQAENSWVRIKGEEWVNEGERWVGRVGRRYGIWGFEKGESGKVTVHEHELEDVVSKRIAGDVANAVLAYGLTKALLPVRIGLSLYLAPGFSRRVVDPLASTVFRPFRRR